MAAPINDGAPGGMTASPQPGEPAGGAGASLSPGGAVGGAAPADAGATDASLADKAKGKLTGALDGRKSAAADLVGDLAQTVARSGEQFRGKQDWIAGALGRGAEELDTLAGSLRDKDVGGLVREVMAFGERRPALFVSAALATGFVVARIGKLAAADLSRDDLPTMPEVAHGRS